MSKPVAWRYQTPTGWHVTTDAAEAMRITKHHPVEPLYATLVEANAQPLTRKQIAHALAVAGINPDVYSDDAKIETIVWAIEAAHGIGATKPQQVEPLCQKCKEPKDEITTCNSVTCPTMRERAAQSSTPVEVRHPTWPNLTPIGTENGTVLPIPPPKERFSFDVDGDVVSRGVSIEDCNAYGDAWVAAERGKK